MLSKELAVVSFYIEDKPIWDVGKEQALPKIFWLRAYSHRKM